MTALPHEIVERLLLTAIEHGQQPDQFLAWVRAYKEGLHILQERHAPTHRQDRDGPRPLPSPPDDTQALALRHGALQYRGKQIQLAPKLAELFQLLHANAGKALSLQEIEQGVSEIAPSTVYPMISRAREALHSLDLPSDEIIKTIRRGMGQKAQYLWNPDYRLDA